MITFKDTENNFNKEDIKEMEAVAQRYLDYAIANKIKQKQIAFACDRDPLTGKIIYGFGIYINEEMYHLNDKNELVKNVKEPTDFCEDCGCEYDVKDMEESCFKPGIWCKDCFKYDDE